MKMHRHVAVFTFLILIGCVVAVPVMLTWRQVRQEQLNHALINAVDGNDVTGVRRLLHEGADPNAPILPLDPRPVWQRIRDMLRRRPPQSFPSDCALMRAINYPQTPEADRMLPTVDNIDTVQVLLDAGADVNFRGGSESRYQYAPTTPLIMAATWGKWQTMKLLLAHHATVDLPNARKETALSWAAAAGGDPEIVEALLQRGANVNAKDDEGGTVLESACADFRKNSIENVRKTVACLLRHGATVGNKDNDGDTALNYARTYWRDRELIHMLKEATEKERKQP